jgi:hypothetical protein
MSNRRGRRRKPGPRYPCGKHRAPAEAKAVDRGTPEQQDRRAWLVQGGRLELAAYPLGVLLANGAISEDEHKAGCRYAWLYRLAFGRVSIAAASYELLGDGASYHEDEAWLRDRAAELSRLQSALGCFMTPTGPKTAIGRQVKRLVDELAVFGKAPRWMLPVAPGPGDCRDAELFLAGIRRLAEVAGGRDRQPGRNVTPVTGAPPRSVPHP